MFLGRDVRGAPRGATRATALPPSGPSCPPTGRVAPFRFADERGPREGCGTLPSFAVADKAEGMDLAEYEYLWKEPGWVLRRLPDGGTGIEHLGRSAALIIEADATYAAVKSEMRRRGVPIVGSDLPRKPGE